MTLTLDDLRDDDKLVSLQHVVLNSAHPREMYLKTTGQPVFISPIAFGVADLIVPRSDLAPLARLMLLEHQEGLKRLPIFGVPLEKGLAYAANATPGTRLKSMFKATQPDGSLNYGTCATLVTHIQRASQCIQIEAWQIVEPDSETFYLHGLLNLDLKSFSHLDGATMHHDKDAAETLFEQGTKMKGLNYQKWFRLDGAISMTDALALARAYFPLESLVIEYVERHAANDA